MLLIAGVAFHAFKESARGRVEDAKKWLWLPRCTPNFLELLLDNPWEFFIVHGGFVENNDGTATLGNHSGLAKMALAQCPFSADKVHGGKEK